VSVDVDTGDFAENLHHKFSQPLKSIRVYTLAFIIANPVGGDNSCAN
jgi:hypothetical protein